MLELTAILKEHGLKVTPQRLSIFKMLRNTHVHPSAETIYNALQEEHPTMSFATVYKTLDTFVQHGIVQQLNLGEDSYRYDADTSKHSHVQCTKCKCVVDLPFLHRVVDLREDVHAATGFALSHEKLYFYGVCPTCQQEAEQ